MAEVTGAPGIIVLDGKEYEMSPLSDKDIETVNNWIRSTIINMVKESMPEGTSGEERDYMMTLAFKTARSVNFTNAAENDFDKLDLVSRMVWQGLRKRYPELTHEWVRKQMMDAATQHDTMARWKELNAGGLEKGGGTTQKGSPKARARRQTRPPSTPG